MILVAGSANLDFVVRAAHVPAAGETVLGHTLRTYPGGKGANQAVASARAGGASTHMLLALGQDAYALPLEASLCDAGVQLHIVRVPELATGTAFVCVADNADNAITVAPGANQALAAQHFPAIGAVSHLLMQLETPLQTVAAYARMARAQATRVVLNAAPAQALDAQLLALVDLLIVNQSELTSMAGGPPGSSIAEQLDRVAVPAVVVTLGPRGCCARIGCEYLVQSAFAVNAVDTTGAGDTFCGVLVAALDQGSDMAHALRRASAAAALACTRAGAQTGVPERQEVNQMLQDAESESPQSQAILRRYCGLPQ